VETGRHRVNLLEMSIDAVDMDSACRRIHEFILVGIPRQIVTVNLDFVRLGMDNTQFRELVNSSSMVVPDGMPLVWASRMVGAPLPERVAGIDLVDQCARLSAEYGYDIFLLGAAPGVANAAAAALRERHPGVRIVGTHSPDSLSDEDDEVTISLIREAQPDILLVAFGAPKQEIWIRKHMQALGVPVCMGVGGSFDMLSGRVNRAPKWMQKNGLEWLYRFKEEPGRLWHRYFVRDLPVFLRLMMQPSRSALVPLPNLAEPVLIDTVAPDLQPEPAVA
jgi:N-acetylglucosaminyldiphosphoundecaprenol N-acetyl-beta-D-mannosaminyltransferase